MTQAELPSRTLEFSVKNDTSFYSSNKKFIGIAQIEMANMDQTKAATLWYVQCWQIHLLNIFVLILKWEKKFIRINEHHKHNTRSSGFNYVPKINKTQHKIKWF